MLQQEGYLQYRIRPNFQGAQFSLIAISKYFAETIFADQEFLIYGILTFRELIFADCYI